MLRQLLSILLWSCCVSVRSEVRFSGFTEGRTIYTNGDGPTQLTCNATYDDVILTNLTWVHGSSGGEVVTGSSVIRFEEVVKEAQWGEMREYYCRVYYQNNTLSEDSNGITVIVQYNTTISINYETTNISFYSYSNSIAILVMTQNVELRCGVESAKWSYDTLHDQSNPLILELLTIQYSTGFFCKDNHGRLVRFVHIAAIGSGIWDQNGSSYTELSEGEVVTLTENVTLVCVTTSLQTGISWSYRGEINAGNGERLTDNTEYDGNRGFLTLTLSQHLPANRTGYYFCATQEIIDVTLNTRYTEHSLQIALPIVPTTKMITHATTPTTTQVSISQSTTPITTTKIITQTTTTPHVTTPSPDSIKVSFRHIPNKVVVFVGVDEVTLECEASIMMSSLITVSIRDHDGELVSKKGNGSVRVQYSLHNFTAGILNYTCAANSNDTDQDSEKEVKIQLATKDAYKQEVNKLSTLYISEQSARLDWSISHEAIADEEFVISINRLNVSTGWEVVGTTTNTSYTLDQLIPGHHYVIRVRVTNRLNANSYTTMYYIHKTTTTTTTTTKTTTPQSGILINTFIIIAVITVVIITVSCGIVLFIVFICVIIRKKKFKISKNNKEHQKLYESIQRQELNKSPSRHKTDTSKHGHYVPLQVMPPTNPLSKDELIKKVSTKPPVKPPKPPTTTNKTDKSYYELDYGYSGTELSGQHVENTDDNYCQIEYETPTGDKVSPDKPCVPLHALRHCVDTLWHDGMRGLGEEFDALQLNLMRSPQQIAKRACNAELNRDGRTLPYDRARIRLNGGHDSDYINASLIPGPFSQQTFIAAQLPISGTSGRFWSMLWEQKVTTVLMVSPRHESRHFYRYWPLKGRTQVEGELRVHTVREEVQEVLVSHLVSLSLCSSPNQTRQVALLEFRGWPENEHCMMSHNIVTFVKTVRNTRGVRGLRGVKSVPERNMSPICVCCVTGSGRTGTIIALYNLLEGVESGRGVSVFNLVNGMRDHRPYMVHTLNQYRLLYVALLEMVAGDTRVDMKTTFLSESEVEREFAQLVYQSEIAFERSTSGGVDGQVDSDTPLPYEDTRVVLNPPLHTFYNACYIRSASGTPVNVFIAAVSPRGDEVCRLLEMVFQHQCPLVVSLGEHNNNNLAQYWEVAGGVKYGSLRVNKLSSVEEAGLFISEIKLDRVGGGGHTFQHLYFSGFSTEGVSSYSTMVKLVDILLRCEDRTHPVVVHCVDGVGATGMLLTVCLGVRGRRGCEVDLFQACMHLRFHRRRMVANSVQYNICYEIARRYLQSLEDNNYENLAAIS